MLLNIKKAASSGSYSPLALTKKHSQHQDNKLPRNSQFELQVNFKHIKAHELTCVHAGVVPAMYLFPALAGGTETPTSKVYQRRKLVHLHNMTVGKNGASSATFHIRDTESVNSRLWFYYGVITTQEESDTFQYISDLSADCLAVLAANDDVELV